MLNTECINYKEKIKKKKENSKNTFTFLIIIFTNRKNLFLSLLLKKNIYYLEVKPSVSISSCWFIMKAMFVREALAMQ